MTSVVRGIFSLFDAALRGGKPIPAGTVQFSEGESGGIYPLAWPREGKD